MKPTPFTFAGQAFQALPSGALWWAKQRTLVVSDMHLGKSMRIARRGGTLLPPYDSEETLARLAADMDALQPTQVISLGDSFDDNFAAEEVSGLQPLLTRCPWVWVQGNHDPAPVGFGEAVPDIGLQGIRFCHIGGGPGPEVSGHWHPKASVSLRHGRITSACFVLDEARMVMPAYGAYTGGLSVHHPELRALFQGTPSVILTRAPGHAIPFTKLCA